MKAVRKERVSSLEDSWEKAGKESFIGYKAASMKSTREVEKGLSSMGTNRSSLLGKKGFSPKPLSLRDSYRGQASK